MNNNLSPLEAIKAWEADCLSKVGFYVHYVPNEWTDGRYNIHTHGIAENFNHPDFQSVVDIEPATAQTIFHGLVGSLKKGKRFEVGSDYPNVINGYNVRFLERKEGRRMLLRIVFPNRAGQLDEAKLEGILKLQYA